MQITKSQTTLTPEDKEQSYSEYGFKSMTPILSSALPKRTHLVDIERDSWIAADDRLRKSVDPYELEMDIIMNNSSDFNCNESRKQYSDEERMLQRQHYLASRNEHTSQAKMTEETLRKQENKKIVNARSRIPKPVKLNDSIINNLENADAVRQLRNFDLQNFNGPTPTRPPSRRHAFNEFCKGDSHLD